MTKRINLIISILAISALFVLTGIAQAGWVKTYSYGEAIFNSSIKKTFDGNFIIAGGLSGGVSPNDNDGVLILKIDSLGDIIWQKRLGKYNSYQANCVIETSDHNYIIAGHERYGGWISKIDPDGNVIWQKALTGYSNGIRSIKNLIETSDGGYLVAGLRIPVTTGYFSVIKLDSSGNVLWQRSGTNPYSSVQSVQEVYDGNGGYIVANERGLIRFNKDGQIEWQKTYSKFGSGIYFYSMCKTADGGFAVCGYLTDPQQILVFKIDSQGNLMWPVAKTYIGYRQAWAQSIAEASNGDLILAGNAYSDDWNYGTKILMLRLDPNGDLKWSRMYGDFQEDETRAHEVILDNSANIIVAGRNFPDNTLNPHRYDLLIMKLNESGLVSDSCDFIHPATLERNEIILQVEDTNHELVETIAEPTDTNLATFDMDLSVITACEGFPSVDPVIAQTPMSGPPSTTFAQWGTGFTPFSTAELWTRDLDGYEQLAEYVPIDDTGHFETTYKPSPYKEPGTYTWWAIDGPTQTKSNEVNYEITEPLPVTLTLSLDPLTAGWVTIDPPNEACNTDCIYNYDAGTEVELMAIENEGWKFECWSDATQCISYDNPFNTVINEDKTIISKFNDGVAQNRRYFALIVGVSRYPLNFNVGIVNGIKNQLLFSRKNATGFKNAILKYGNWSSKNIKMLRNKKATKANIKENILNMSKEITSKDVFLFYFSGHGYPEESSEYKYICSYGENKEEWIRGDELAKWLEEFKTNNIIVVLESCFSGGIINDLKDLPGIMIMTATNEDEEANAGGFTHGQSQFTHFVIKSIEEFTDYSENKELSVEEVYNYLITDPNALSWVGPQHPLLWDGYPHPDFYQADEQTLCY